MKKSNVSGVQLTEAVNINLGLLSLKNCIAKLRTKSGYIPYADNRLTELLRNALSGQSKTLVVVGARAEPEHVIETIHACRFGMRCREIESSSRPGAG